MLHDWSCVDDSLVAQSGQLKEVARDLTNAIDYREERMPDHNLDLHQVNSQVWATDAPGRAELSHLLHTLFKDLGYDLTFRGTGAHDNSEERVDAAVAAYDRAEKPRLGKAVEQALQTVILTKAQFITENDDAHSTN
eukprot:6039856-Amphidinium_carterae.1